MTSRPHPWPCLGATAALTALLMLHSRSAAACSCADPAEPDAAIANADVVFEGTPRHTAVLEAERDVLYGGMRRFDFEVTRYFKGQLGPDVTILTSVDGSACGREYPLGEPYVVYAYSYEGVLRDSSCSPSHPSSLASGDASFLGPGIAPDPSLASAGDDEHAEDDGAEDESDATQAPGASSGIHRVPLDTEPEPRGCAASLALPPEHEGAGLLTLASLALAASAGRRRRAG